MSLADCIKKVKVSKEVADEINAAGLAEYQAGLMGDLESLRTQLTEAGLDVPAVKVPERLTTRELFQSSQNTTDTPEFKAWFGDSKVVDANGEPMVVFHGTTKDFKSFRSFSHFGTKGAANEILEPSMDPRHSDKFAPRMLPVYLSIKNPVRIEDSASPHTVEDLTIRLENAGLLSLDDDGASSIDRILEPSDEFERAARLTEEMKKIGVDGFVYKNLVEDAGTDSYIIADPSQVKSVHNVGTFDPSDPRILNQDKRASIRFTPGGTTINLGLGADRSSFLHESGHLFLEQLRTDQKEFGVGSPELVDDWNTITKWWEKNASALKKEAIDLASKANDTDAVAILAGMSDKKIKDFVVTGELDRSQDAQGYLSVAMHEQWARGVEDYFRTGQAPSVALQDAFNRFRAWMVSIYKRAIGRGGLDIQFSPDVKAVMDRLLATDEEIDLMASQYDMKAMFGSAKEIGMTEGQFKNYQKDVARSVEEGKTRQLKKHMNDIERERQNWWMDERNSIKVQVEKEVHERREYKLMYALTNGTEPNGESLKVRPNRMSRRAIDLILENEKTATKLPKIGNKVLYTTASKEGSSHPDIVAMTYGYENSRDMLIELANVPPMNEVIEAEADARMKAKHGDMQLSDKAEAEAVESIHGDKRGDVLAAEVNALREGQEKIKPAFVREWAKEQIGKQKVGNIKPTKFLAAEKRFAKLAAKEFKAGNMLEAQRAKFRQMMNYFMAKESYKVRTELDKSRNYMRKFNKKKGLFKSIDADYVDRIKEILGSHQLGPRLSDKKRLTIELATFNNWLQRQAEDEGAIFNIPQEILDADEKTHFRDLTLDEFRTLTDTIKNLEAQGRKQKGILIDGQMVEIEQIESDIKARLDLLPVKVTEAAKAFRQDASIGLKNQTLDRIGAKFLGRFLSFDAYMRKVEFLLEFMDGGEKLGPSHQAFYQPAADSEVMKNAIVRKVNKVFIEKMEALPPEVRKKMGRDQYIPSLGREMNRGNLIMLALNVGNESNFDKTIRGSEQDAGANWTGKGIMEALEVLSKEEWDFVQAVWDAFDGIYPQVQEIYRREFGRSPEKIESREFDVFYSVETPGGGVTQVARRVTGRYFPMMYDPSRSAMAETIAAKSSLEAMQSQAVKSSVFSGMVKARTGFSAPVLLDINALPQAVVKMAHYVSYYETVRSINKLLSRKTLRSAITEKLGTPYYNEMNLWIGDVATDGQVVAQRDPVSRGVEAMRSTVTTAIMGFSYTTMMVQPLGLSMSVDALANSGLGVGLPGATLALAKGLGKSSKDVTQNTKSLVKAKLALAKGIEDSISQSGIVERIKKDSGFMLDRIDNMDRDAGHAIKEFSQKPTKANKVKAATMLHILYTQFYVVDIPTFLAAENLALKSGMSEGKAIKFAEHIVRTSQGSGATLDLARIQRTPGMMRALTMFMTFFSVLYNALAIITGKVNIKSPASVLKFTIRMGTILVATQAAEALMRGEKPDDDEDYASWLALKSFFFATSSVPLLRDGMGIAQGYGYSSTPIDSIPVSVFAAWDEAAKAIKDGEMTRELAIKTYEALGYIKGFPVTQPKRFLKAMDKWEETGTMPDKVEFLRGPDDD